MKEVTLILALEVWPFGQAEPSGEGIPGMRMVLAKFRGMIHTKGMSNSLLPGSWGAGFWERRRQGGIEVWEKWASGFQGLGMHLTEKAMEQWRTVREETTEGLWEDYLATEESKDREAREVSGWGHHPGER